MNSNSFWLFETGFRFLHAHLDDRELADGTPIERQGSFQWFGYVSTDSRKRSRCSSTGPRAAPSALRAAEPARGTLVFQPLPQLDGSFDLAYTESAGTIRQISRSRPRSPIQRDRRSGD